MWKNLVNNQKEFTIESHWSFIVVETCLQFVIWTYSQNLLLYAFYWIVLNVKNFRLSFRFRGIQMNFFPENMIDHSMWLSVDFACRQPRVVQDLADCTTNLLLLLCTGKNYSYGKAGWILNGTDGDFHRKRAIVDFDVNQSDWLMVKNKVINHERLNQRLYVLILSG